MTFIRLAVFLSVLAAASPLRFSSAGQGASGCSALSVCVPISKCPSGLKALRRRQALPPLCGYKGNLLKVCCPELRASAKSLSASGQVTTTTDQNSVGRSSPPKVGARSAEACQKYSEIAFPKINLFVKNGIEADVGEFPHMALLGFKYDKDQQNSGRTLTKGVNASWLCCGTLIHERFVLTAAHCLEKEFPIVVRLGDLDWNSDEDGAQPKEFSILRIESHPEFNRISLANDIALIELGTQVPFNWVMQPACLPAPGENQDALGQDLLVTGWGDTAYDSLSATSMLMKASLRAVDFEVCNATYAGTQTGGLLEDKQMCAVDPKRLADACRGDSGGPLQVRVKDSQLMKVVGVTSSGIGCGSSPGLYTRVSAYIEWIENIVWPSNARLCNREYYNLPAPGENQDALGQDLLVTGWGDTAYDSLSATSMLMKASLRAVDFELEDKQMCAVDPKRLADACRGDSGGPLQVRVKDSQLMKVVGVTSSGIGCGSSPGLYTRVSAYIEWIENIVWPSK
ncbi:serine protease persephone-like [Cloeon dipterum]|uniref:serine protease persephone-like n=1 Tax=Cloeon dipterum TaxID=197152 RepID=UPI00322006B2